MSKVTFEPLGGRILVTRAEGETRRSSGLIIPEQYKDKPLVGKVVAADKRILEDEILKVGDIVMFDKYGGVDIKLENEDFMVLKINDILGIIRH